MYCGGKFIVPATAGTMVAAAAVIGKASSEEGISPPAPIVLAGAYV
jgi:hypothetical protein